jgi:hypothetical protein
MNKFLGITLIVIALAIAIIPAFTDCQSQGRSLALANGGTTAMKCHWTAQAEIASGVPLLAVGAMMVVIRRKKALITLGVMGSIVGIFTILLPTQLIGVCQTTMLCNTIMKPSLTVFGSLAIIVSLGAMVLARKMGD